jgi:predicted dehydrogenase
MSSQRKPKQRSDTKLRQLGVAQIGYGVLGKALYKTIEADDRFKNVALYDTNKHILQTLDAVRGCDLLITRNFEEVLENPNIDIIFVNTPAENHFTICKQALKSSKHVHCAKPLTLTLSEGQSLVDLANSSNVSLTVGHQMKYSSHFQYVKQLINAGTLGEITSMTFINNKRRPDPKNLKHQTNPILWEMTSHHLDTLLYFFPEEEWQLCGVTLYRPSTSTYDSNTHVNALLKSSSGRYLNYQSGFDTLRSNYFFRLEGSKCVLDILGDHISTPVNHYLLTKTNGDSLLIKPPITPLSAWSKVLDEIIVDINHNQKSEISGLKNLDVLKIITEMERNAN